MKIRRLSAWVLPLAFLSVLSATVTACGTHFQFAGRTVAPSCLGFTNAHDVARCHRALVAIRNADAGGDGALQILDAANDQHESVDGRTLTFLIKGYKGTNPSFLLNYPEEQRGFVYNAGDGVVDSIDYTTETAQPSSLTSGGTPNVNSLAISSDGRYFYAARQVANVVTVTDLNQGISNLQLKLPNVFRVSANPAGTVALVFVENSNTVNRILRLEGNQAAPPDATDCEPANVPRYCLLPVPGNFDRPVGAYFSLDGSSAFILNSGPEMGGTTASISIIPTSAITTTTFPTGPITSPVTATIPVPGGATVALSDGNTLYVAGSQIQNGLFAGRLSVINIPSQAVTATYNISDGSHGVMRFADDNTLWIGSTLCASGASNTGPTPTNGCLTMFNRSTNAVLIEPYMGDVTGIADIVSFHKVYVAENGEIFRYNTPDGSNPSVPNILVGGSAIDVAYMDAPSNAQD